jgi:hypothetical protein
MDVTTDHKWKSLRYGYEVPAKVLADQFDWMDEDESGHGFFCYHGRWYNVQEFMRTDVKGWDGMHGDSFFSGVLIRLSKDGESYMVATYYS